MASASKKGSRRQRSRIRVAVIIALALVMVLPLEASAATDDFVNKLSRGVTERVSVSSSGAEGNGGSDSESASDDGRFIAFTSGAGNLHPADVNGKTMPDVFVYDRKKRELDLVSVLPNGLAPENPAPNADTPGHGLFGSGGPKISGNGRYVAFQSNLPLTGVEDSDDGSILQRVYVRDLKARKTELISRTWDGEAPDADSGTASISDDGRWVAFVSRAVNLMKGGCPSSEVVPGVPLALEDVTCQHVYARDRRNDKTVLASEPADGMPSRYEALYPAISGNGRYVVFVVEGDVWVRDLRRGETELVSASRDGDQPANGGSWLWFQGDYISDNGRYVAFSSYASDLVPANPTLQDAYGAISLVCGGSRYVRDRKTGRVERISVTSTGNFLHNGHAPGLSDNGRSVIFEAKSYHFACIDNATDEANAFHGDFIQDRFTGQVDMVSCPGNAREGFDTSDKGCPKIGDEFGSPSIGGNGRFIHGTHYDGDVVANDTNDAYDVFVRDIGHYPLGVGPLGGSPSKDQEPPSDDICVAPDVCVPPQSSLSWRADGDADEALTKAGAKLYGASLAYRPALGDLYAAIELEHMGPALTIGPAGVVTGGSPSLLYGLRFQVADKAYEVRATSLLGGTFGLFDCSDTAPLCTQVATLKGGYGTTGERVVVSLPLDEIGLKDGGKLTGVTAFTAYGALTTGAIEILDTVRLGNSGRRGRP